MKHPTNQHWISFGQGPLRYVKGAGAALLRVCRKYGQTVSLGRNHEAFIVSFVYFWSLPASVAQSFSADRRNCSTTLEAVL